MKGKEFCLENFKGPSWFMFFTYNMLLWLTCEDYKSLKGFFAIFVIKTHSILFKTCHNSWVLKTWYGLKEKTSLFCVMVHHIWNFGLQHHMSLHSWYNHIYMEVLVLYKKGDMLQLKGQYFKFSMHVVYGIIYWLNVDVVDHLILTFWHPMLEYMCWLCYCCTFNVVLNENLDMRFDVKFMLSFKLAFYVVVDVVIWYVISHILGNILGTWFVDGG